MDTQKLHNLIDKVIGKSGPLRVPAYWMGRVLKKVVGYLTELKARIDAMPKPGRGLNYDNISGKVNVDDSVVMIDETTPEKDIFSGDELIPLVEEGGVKATRISSLFPNDYDVELPELTLPLDLKQDTQSVTWPTPSVTVLASYWGYRLPGDTSIADQFNILMQELLNTMEEGQFVRVKLILDTPLFTSEPLIVAAEKVVTSNYAGVTRYLKIKCQFKSLVVRYKYNLSNTMKPVYLTSSISGDISITLKPSLLGYVFVVNAFDDNYSLCIDYRHPELFRKAWVLRNTNLNLIWVNLDIGVHVVNLNASNPEFTILSKGSLATYKLSYATDNSGSIDLVAKVDITDSGDGTKFLSDDGTYKPLTAVDEDLPVFDLEFSSSIVSTIMQPSSYFYSYYIEADVIRASEVEFDENNQAKIKVNINTDVFRTLQPIVAEVTKGIGYGATAYEQVIINLDFNNVPVIWYDKFIEFISGSISGTVNTSKLANVYRLKLSYDTPIILSSEDTTASHVSLVRCFGIRPCKFINHASSYDYIYGGQLTSKTDMVPAADANVDPYAICLDSDNTLYKVAVTADGLRYTTVKLKADKFVLDLTNDTLDTDTAEYCGRLISTNLASFDINSVTIKLHNEYFALIGARIVNVSVTSTPVNRLQMTFGNTTLYNVEVHVTPSLSGMTIVYSGTVTSRQSVNLFELNSRLNALENAQE